MRQMAQTFIDRLERKGRAFAIPGLASWLVGMNVLVGVLSFIKPEFPLQLMLDPFLIRQGQLWRVVTFLFIPPELSPLNLFLWLLLFYLYTTALERIWGDFKFTLFCAVGVAAAVTASLAFNIVLSASFFDSSFFLAFARLNPEFTLLLLFIIPVKMKWLAWGLWIMWGLQFVSGGAAAKIEIIAGAANYFFFFGAEHWREWRWSLRRLLNHG